MALPAPPVLQRLHALGLSQTAVAGYLGVTQAAVSMWLAGKRPLIEPWRTDAARLLLVAREHLAQGGSLEAIPFRPAHYMNVGGMTATGEEAPLTETDYAALVALQQSLTGQSPERFMAGLAIWHAQHTAAHLTARLAGLDPQTAAIAATDLDTLCRMAHALVLNLTSLVHSKARHAGEGDPGAHQTP